jgi:hypothetical protein
MIKIAVFWVVVPCSLVEVYQRFEVLAASIIIVLKMTLVNYYQTPRRYNPEDNIFVLTAVRTSNPNHSGQPACSQYVNHAPPSAWSVV